MGHDTIEYDMLCQEKKTKVQHPPDCSDGETEPSHRVETELSHGCSDINTHLPDKKGNDNFLTVKLLPPGISDLDVDNND